MNPSSRQIPARLILLTLLLAACRLSAASLSPLTLERLPEESGYYSRLQWSAEPGLLYQLQTATNLSVNAGNNINWDFGDALVADSTNAVLEIRGRSIPENSIEFFRLAAPVGIFDVQPGFVDSGDSNATFYLVGQMLPADATVFINGQAFAATNDGGALHIVSLNGLPPGQPILGTITVVDNATGATNSQYAVLSGLLYGAQPTSEQLQGPPSDPPAAPTFRSRGIPKGRPGMGTAVARLIAPPNDGKDDDCNGGEDAPVGGSLHLRVNPRRVQSHKGDFGQIPAGRIPEDCDDRDGGVYLGTGELRLQETDLAISGRMLDFAWTRTYRSRTGPTTEQGAGWDFSYNVSLAQNGDGTLTLRPGNGRADTFYPDGTNGWIRDEYFVEIRDLDADGYPDVLFADTGKWLFHPLGTPAGGKLARIIDRNGNTMTLNYDGAGRLAEVVDDLGRTNTVAYSPVGLIESVTDFTGRHVRYEYDGNGDLVGVVSPSTPDFPGGITNRYTYSSGYTNAAENHLLLSIIDGKGQTKSEHVYQHNQTDYDFLRCVSVQSGPHPPAQFTYLPVTPSPANSFATTKAIVRDAVGNVTERFHDSRQRCVRLLEYTGRAPNLFSPTTQTVNRPVNKLRAADPDYFETQWSWNPDSLCTLEVRGDGSRTEIVHQRVQDHNSSRSNKTASRRHGGNVLVVRERAAAGEGGDLDGDGVPDYTELVWRFEYDPRFGAASTPGRLGGTHLQLKRGHNSSRSNKTASSIDMDDGAGDKSGGTKVQDHNSSRSNKTASSIDLDDGGDVFGDITRQFTRGTRVQDHNSSRSNKTGSVLDDGLDGDNTPIIRSGLRGHAALQGEASHSGRAVARPGLRDSSCASGLCADGFVTSVTDPRGNMTTVEYDSTGNRTKSIKQGHYAVANFHVEVDGLYNSHGQLTAVTNAPDADGYRRVDTLRYYTNGPQAGQLETFAIDEPGVHLTSSFEYDARGNLTRYVDPRTNDWLYTYDALDRRVSRQTPNSSFGSRTTTLFTYDANGNLVQTTTDLRDENNNFRHNVVWNAQYDLGNRCTAVIRQASPGVLITNRFDYDAGGNLVACRSPLAVDGTDPHAVVQFEYDERNFLWRQTAGPLAPHRTTTELSYDPNGKPKSITVGIGVTAVGGTFTVPSRCFGQPASIIDPMGNVTSFNYDRNGNLTRVRSYGETNDVPGSVGNRLLAETRYTYDALDRRVQMVDSFFDVFTELSLGDGAATTTYSYAPNGACTSVTDDNGHTTSFGYDTAGRLAAVTSPGAKSVVAWFRDAAGNVTQITRTDTPDLGGAAQVFTRDYSYDSLNRLAADWDNVGNTNRYAYDSLGRCVKTTDARGNDMALLFDDLGRCLGATHFVGAKESGITINTSHTEYDVNNRCVSVTDANTNTTLFAYDSLGRRTSVTGADGTVCSLIWSPRSNLLRVQDANGTVITNTYDLLDRCVRRDITPGAGVAASTTFETFAFDGRSRCVMASNNVSRLECEYDSMGNQTRSTQGGRDVLLVYDQNMNCTSVTYPGGSVVNYTYNLLDEVASVSHSAGGGAPPVTLATYAYAGPGRVSRIQHGNGLTTTLTWNGLVSPPNASGDFGHGRVSAISVTRGGSVIEGRSLTYDRNQNKTSRVQTVPFVPGGNVLQNALGYDALDRLVSFTHVTGSPDDYFRGYQLDANGNRQVALSNGVAQPYTMEATIPPGDFQMNQYTLTPFDQRQYDENGNLRALVSGYPFDPDVRELVYDYANRLVLVQDIDSSSGLAVTNPVAAYTYDALGRRIAKTVFPAGGLPPITIDYVHGDDDCDGVIEEYTGGTLSVSHVSAVSTLSGAGGGAASAAYAATGRIIATIGAGGQTTYLHNDDVGNTLALTDAKGNVIERYDYDDFGQPSFQTSDGAPLVGSDGLPVISSPAGNAFLFHGLEWDAETGFYHSNGGGFDPQTGKSINGINGGMPNRISMNVTVPKQTQGATFGEKVNAGLHAAGSAVAQGASLLDNNPWSLKKEEGGRHTPFHNKYRPMFRTCFATGDIPTQEDFWDLIDTPSLRTTGWPRHHGHITLIK